MVDLSGDLALWAAAAALAIGAFIAGLTIRQAQLTTKRQATFRYVERIAAPRIRRIIERGSRIWDLDPARQRPQHVHIWQKVQTWIWPPLAPTVQDAKALGRLRYHAASVRVQLEIGELYDLYEEVSAIYGRGLLDDAIFRDMVAPELVYEWRIGHWLINYLRQTDEGVIDVGIYENWQRVYRQLIERPLAYDAVDDSEPDAGDYARLPDRKPLLWPDRVRWTGFRNAL